MKKIISVTLLLGVLLTTFSSCNLLRFFAQQYQSHPTIDFNDLTFTEYTEEEFNELENRIKTMIEEKSSSIVILTATDSLFRLANEVSATANYYSIVYHNDVTNTENAQKLVDAQTKSVLWADRCSNVAKLVANSHCAEDAKEYWGAEVFEVYKNYQSQSGDLEDYTLREAELINKHGEIVSRQYTANYNGKKLTSEEIIQLNLDEDTETKLLTEISKQINRDVEELLFELVDLRKSFYGDSIVDISYSGMYMRDYTYEELSEVFEDAKTYLTPIYKKLSQELKQNSIPNIYKVPENADMKKVLRDIGDRLISKFPLFSSSFNHMYEYNYYSVDFSAKKYPGNYTTIISSVVTPYMFINPNNSINDIKTIIHELGHYNAMFNNPFQNYTDVCEIHSQALELMCMDIVSEYSYPEYRDVVKEASFLSTIEAVLVGLAYSEFEARVYQGNYDSIDELNKMMMDICVDFGLVERDEREMLYGWTETIHFFASPFYFSSYSTSAFSSIDLFFKYVDDPNTATESYKTLIMTKNNYKEACKEAGIASIFDENIFETLSAKIKTYMGI